MKLLLSLLLITLSLQSYRKHTLKRMKSKSIDSLDFNKFKQSMDKYAYLHQDFCLKFSDIALARILSETNLEFKDYLSESKILSKTHKAMTKYIVEKKLTRKSLKI